MRDVLIDDEGNLRCPKCKTGTFDRERTVKAKTAGFLTVGPGLFLLPKRMRCLACGTISKSGNAKPLNPPGRQSKPPKATPMVPARPPQLTVDELEGLEGELPLDEEDKRSRTCTKCDRYVPHSLSFIGHISKCRGRMVRPRRSGR